MNNHLKFQVTFAALHVLSAVCPLWGQISYFDSYRPNYFCVSMEEEEPHVEFLLSLRYPRIRGPHGDRRTHEMYGSYSGLYDFDVFTRTSSPVVSRMQNVGVHYRWNLKPSKIGWCRDFLGVKNLVLRYFDIQLTHESNGQSVETTEQYLALLNSEDRYIRDNADDYVSMSTHYLGIETHLRYDFSDNHNFYAFIECRPLMMTPEDSVFSQREYKGHINRYKLFRITIGHEYGIAASEAKQTPRKYWDITFYLHAVEAKWQFMILRHVPLFIALGTDKPDEISTYHRQDWYVSMGMALR
ncbi:hypothetical protein JW948_10500 [bacterium]|nr:hypothetical protein [bacterium]